MRDCRVQRDRKSRKQPMRLLWTSPSHVTDPQLLPRSPEVRARPEVKKITRCMTNKNHFFDFNTISMSCLGYIRDVCDFLLTSRPLFINPLRGLLHLQSSYIRMDNCMHLCLVLFYRKLCRTFCFVERPEFVFFQHSVENNKGS